MPEDVSQKKANTFLMIAKVVEKAAIGLLLFLGAFLFWTLVEVREEQAKLKGTPEILSQLSKLSPN